MRGTIAVIGAGLVGGSLLRALARTRGPDALVAVDSNPLTREAISNELGVRAWPEWSDGAAELVVLATPLPAVLELISSLGPRLRGSVLTDVAGIKGPVLEAARQLPEDVPFVGGHPMAGRETGGFDASDAELFRGRTIALCPAPRADARAYDLVAAMWTEAGATVVPCSAEAHDAAVARVSHLPYLVASALALVAGRGDGLARALAAGGLRDTTRVAEDPTLRHVARANPHLAPLAREVAAELTELADRLERGAPMDALLDEAARVRKALFPR